MLTNHRPRGAFIAGAAVLATLASALAPTSASLAAQAKGPLVSTATTSLGRILVDAHGHTLYLFEKDKNGKSACNGTCAKVWAPYLSSGKASVGSGLSASKVGTTKRSDGTTQVTYNGHPLYHYDDDKKPGQTEGQGSKAFGAEWYVLNAKGNKIDES